MKMIAAILLFLWPFSPNETAVQEITDIKEKMKGYYATNLDSAALLAELIVTKSKAAGYQLGQAKGEFSIAYIAYKQGKTAKAIPHFLAALNLYVPLKSDDALKDQANICTTLGKIYWMHNSQNEAIEIYDRGIQFALKADDDRILVKLLHNKALAHRKKGEFAEATSLLMYKLDVISEEDKRGKYDTYNQLGLIHHYLEEYEKARDWYLKMIQLESNDKPKQYLGKAYHNMALTYQEQKNYPLAWKYYKLSLEEKRSLGSPKKLFILYHDMADLALSENQLTLAKNYAEKALLLIDEVPKTPDYYNVYHVLSRCLQSSDPEQAFKYNDMYVSQNEMYNTRRDELISYGEKYKVNLITSNYFYKLRRHEQNNKLAWLISCALAFIFLAAVLIHKLWKIHNYKSPQLALSHIKNQSEMVYLLDLFRKEKDEMKSTLRQSKNF